MARRKFADRSSLGRSKIAPYLPGEDPATRHDRRLRANLAARERFDAWAAGAGLTLKISNEGHHWRILRADGSLLAQWWPSSAKLVYGTAFSRGVHCHDVDILRRELARRIAP